MWAMTPAGATDRRNRGVADSVWIHHSQSHLKLPTKAGKLDWSLGDVVRPLKQNAAPPEYFERLGLEV